MRYLIMAAACVAAIPSVAAADTAEDSDFQAELGVAGGGAPGLLFDVPHVRRTTTEKLSGILHFRIRAPKVSPRTIELYAVNMNGAGLNVRNDDFALLDGTLRFHLLDVGLFYNYGTPVSVGRVERDLDITFGAGIDHRFSRSWSWTLDARIFFPANVFRVLTDYGDFARLVGYEAMQGGQTWLGVMYCF